MTRHRCGPAGLSRERIAEAAVKIAFEGGVWGVTMRGVGRALGVEAMSLYGYVTSKDDLLLAMVEHVCGPDVATTVEFRGGMSDVMRDFVVAQRYTLIAGAVADADTP